MRKSITGFICGLIGSLFSLFWGFVCGITGSAFGLATDAAEVIVFQVLGWVSFLGAILGIVGAALCIKKAKKGAICLTIASALCGALQIYLFVKAFATSFLMTSIIVFLLPTILLIVSTVFAWIAKPSQVNNLNHQNMQQTVYQKPNENDMPPMKEEPTLEKELNGLKDMLDKNLITEEEYAEAKKNVLNKYTK